MELEGLVVDEDVWGFVVAGIKVSASRAAVGAWICPSEIWEISCAFRRWVELTRRIRRSAGGVWRMVFLFCFVEYDGERSGLMGVVV